MKRSECEAPMIIIIIPIVYCWNFPMNPHVSHLVGTSVGLS